jgi:hypothetical protein
MTNPQNFICKTVSTLETIFKINLHQTKILSIFDYSFMPIGIPITMTTTKRAFASVKQLEKLITHYFEPPESGKADSPSLAELAFILGFNSRQEFEACEAKGRYSATLKRARLRIEATFEKKLHDSSGGAVFALKNMGWDERPDNKATDKETDRLLQVEIVPSALKPSSSESEVIL